LCLASFRLNKQLQHKVQKGFDVAILRFQGLIEMFQDFKLIIDADILAFWASFPENWAKF
jgi:hypothetical protein